MEKNQNLESRNAVLKTPSPSLSAEERIAWLRLIRSQNVGPLTFNELINRFGAASEALEQIPRLAQQGGVCRKLTPYTRNQALQEMEQIKKYGAHLLLRDDPDYPQALKQIPDAPPLLTVKGNLKALNQKTIGIVGSRNASLNGKKFAENLARELGASRYIIASGLARGIDAYAHRGSLLTGTIGVVAGGINIIYPPENTLLYEQILDKGAIIAESPFGVEPQSPFFPKRNRLISGLSLGLVIVEAALKSGSLITARYALEQNREVFAVPGSPFDPRCQGTNNLIRQGATLIQKAEDVLEGLPSLQKFYASEQLILPYESHLQITPSEKDAKKIRDDLLINLSYTPISIDELVRQCHVSASEAQYILLELELAGRVQRHSGNKVSLIGNI